MISDAIANPTSLSMHSSIHPFIIDVSLNVFPMICFELHIQNCQFIQLMYSFQIDIDEIDCLQYPMIFNVHFTSDLSMFLSERVRPQEGE